MKKLMKWLIVTTLVCGGSGFTSCTNDTGDNPITPSNLPLIILDTDLGSSTDDLFAMELLYDYEAQGRCKLLGIIVDREGE